MVNSEFGRLCFSESLRPVQAQHQPKPALSILSTGAKLVRSFLENRGGLAQVIGFYMVPSQFTSPNYSEATSPLRRASFVNPGSLHLFSCPIKDGIGCIRGVIYYPDGWDSKDCSRAILYHNPNGMSVSEYFIDGNLSWTPGEMVRLAKCPIILYDYRKTGLSSESLVYPTAETVLTDGETALEYALEHFEHLCIMGTSLGGAVATVSLERHLTKHPEDVDRVTLINHSSFSTTPRVLFPRYPRLADSLGWLFGGLINAEASMHALMQKDISIVVLSYTQDPEIPAGARMVECLEKIAHKHDTMIICSNDYGHTQLSQGMLNILKEIKPYSF